MPRDGEMPVATRARRAISPVTPKPSSPSAQTEAAKSRSGEGANCAAASKRTPPLSPNPIGPAQAEAGGEGQGESGTHGAAALAAIVSELVSLQRKRQFCIVSQSRGDRSIESLIASTMGFRIDADEKDRKALFARAKAFRQASEDRAELFDLRAAAAKEIDKKKKARLFRCVSVLQKRIERGGEGHGYGDDQAATALSAIVPLILAARDNRKPWDDLRKAAEKDMERLAKQLPCYAFAKGVKGFGDLALAVLQAEAGIPFGEYRTVSGLWKRMGLAVINGERQRRKSGDAALEHAYSPRRRAEVFAFISDSMFRHQWRAEREDSPAGPAGPYGEVYAKRRAHTDPRIEATADLPVAERWTKARCHNDARRVMSKALLRDLWRVSRGLPPRV